MDEIDGLVDLRLNLAFGNIFSGFLSQKLENCVLTGTCWKFLKIDNLWKLLFLNVYNTFFPRIQHFWGRCQKFVK